MNTDNHTLYPYGKAKARRPLPPALTDKLLSFGMLLICCVVLTATRCKQFSSGNSGTTCAWITACSVTIMLLLSLRSRRIFLPELRHGLLSVTFGASVSACLLLTAVGISIYFARFAAIPVTDENTFISFLMKGFALLTAAYFLVSSASDILSKQKTLHLLFSMAPIFFCALRLLNTFINNSALPLASAGGYRIIGMIAAMLFFLNEGKLLLGVKTASAYLFTGYTAAIFCAAYDLPLMITGIRNGGTGPDAAYSLLTLGLVAYILTRIATIPARSEEAAE